MALLVTLLFSCGGSSQIEGPDRSPEVADPAQLAALHPSGRGEDAIVLGSTPRNLLVISLDTTRRDRVGFFSDLDTTPNLDAAFADGVILADHRSCSNWTAPSTYCAQSGNFHLEEDVWLSSGDEPSHDRRVDWPSKTLPTLASILSDNGFDTHLVTTNSYFSSVYNGNGYGFDHVVQQFWQGADAALEAATAESEELGADGNPWYMHVHFFDPHESYEAPRAYWTDPRFECPWGAVRNTNLQARLEGGATWARLDEADREVARECLYNIYEGDLRYWDERFGEMWADFESRGLLDNTLVVFWTDHGQSFGEHDDKFNHGVTLYDTENRSTAAFWAHDIEPLRWTGPTTHQDLVPTILHALRVPPGEHSGVVLGHARYDRVRIAFNYLQGYSNPLISAIQVDKKLMYWWDGTKRFYDLATDPDEESDIYDASDADVIALWEELQPIVEHTTEIWPRLNPRAIGP